MYQSTPWNALLQFMGTYGVYVWLIIAILFLFVELATPGLFFFISCALGATAAAVAAVFDFSLVTQCMIALGGSVSTFIFLRFLTKKYHLAPVEYERPHTNIDALIGKTGIVTKTIPPSESGQVKVGNELWAAQEVNKETLYAGTHVTILRIQGNKLIVKGL
jgi:membrane protein implicated in regulation of membrane protease activity